MLYLSADRGYSLATLVATFVTRLYKERDGATHRPYVHGGRMIGLELLMSKLDRNLHALAICYRILGALAGLVLTFFTILMFGSNLLSGGSISVAGLVFALPLLLIGGTVVFGVFEVASSLQNHERRTFCLVVAWLVCALFPLGTVLGVFTILQLMQPEAERTFSEAELPYVKTEDFRNQEGRTAG